MTSRLITQTQEEASSSSSIRGHSVRECQIHPSLADGVLIRHMDPDRTDIAAHGEENAIASASQSEAEEEDDEDDDDEVKPAQLRTREYTRVHQMAESNTLSQTKDTTVALDSLVSSRLVVSR